MAAILASAQQTDSSVSQWAVILTSLLVIGVAAVMVAIPIAIARRRLHRRAESITLAAIVWGLLTAGSIVYYLQADLAWQNDYLANIKTGYYDPADRSGAPAWPGTRLAVLAGVFVVLVGYSVFGNRTPAKSQNSRPPQPIDDAGNGQGHSDATG